MYNSFVPYPQEETEDAALAPVEVDGQYHFEAKQEMPLDGFQL